MSLSLFFGNIIFGMLIDATKGFAAPGFFMACCGATAMFAVKYLESVVVERSTSNCNASRDNNSADKDNEQSRTDYSNSIESPNDLVLRSVATLGYSDFGRSFSYSHCSPPRASPSAADAHRLWQQKSRSVLSSAELAYLMHSEDNNADDVCNENTNNIRKIPANMLFNDRRTSNLSINSSIITLSAAAALSKTDHNHTFDGILARRKANRVGEESKISEYEDLRRDFRKRQRLKLSKQTRSASLSRSHGKRNADCQFQQLLDTRVKILNPSEYHASVLMNTRADFRSGKRLLDKIRDYEQCQTLSSSLTKLRRSNSEPVMELYSSKNIITSSSIAVPGGFRRHQVHGRVGTNPEQLSQALKSVPFS